MIILRLRAPMNLSISRLPLGLTTAFRATPALKSLRCLAVPRECAPTTVCTRASSYADRDFAGTIRTIEGRGTAEIGLAPSTRGSPVHGPAHQRFRTDKAFPTAVQGSSMNWKDKRPSGTISSHEERQTKNRTSGCSVTAGAIAPTSERMPRRSGWCQR
jgi:hypothetical protein